MDSIKEFCLTKKETINNSSIFIKEPVSKVIQKINESESNKIILSGNFDSGKRITSMKYIDEKNENNELAFYFNSILLSEYTESIEKNKLESYIEVKIALELLSLIKSIGITIKPVILKMNLYIHSSKINIDLLRNYKCGDLVCPLLYILKKATGIQNVEFILNNIDGLSKEIQNKYKNYFDLFHKTILLINDDIYNDENGCKEFNEKGYDVIAVDYAKDYEVARKMIDSRLEYHNLLNPKESLLSILKMIREDDFKAFIDSTDGNIRYILCTMKEFYLSDFTPLDIDAINFIINKTEQCKNLRYRNLYPSKKLYL